MDVAVRLGVIVDDLARLAEEEYALLSGAARAEVRRAIPLAVGMAFGVVCLGLSSALFCLALVVLLAGAGLPLWAACAIVAAPLAVLGAVALGSVRRAAREVRWKREGF